MKKFLKIVSLLSAVCAAAWVLRDRLLPGPTPPNSHPPAFRNPPAPPQARPVPPSVGAADPAETTAPGSGDDLTAVNGIGPVYAKKLAAAGVSSFRALAASDADELAELTGISRERVADWIAKAALLA